MMLGKKKTIIIESISHNLRNPLYGVLAHIESAYYNCTDPSLKEKLEIARNSAYILDFHLNDFFDYSQILLRKIMPFNSLFELAPAIQQIVDIYRFQMKNKKLTFIFNYHSIEEISVFTDECRLKNLLFNLLGTSINCSEKGGLIKLEVRSEEIENRKIIGFSISFSGRIFSQEELNDILKLTLSSQVDFNPTLMGMSFGLPISFYVAKMLSSTLDEPGIKISLGNEK